jgi:hypothetical protein
MLFADADAVITQSTPAREPRRPMDLGNATPLQEKWYSGGDLNPYAFRHTPLKRTCLPFHHPSILWGGLDSDLGWRRKSLFAGKRTTQPPWIRPERLARLAESHLHVAGGTLLVHASAGLMVSLRHVPFPNAESFFPSTRSLARDHAGNDRNETRGAPWLEGDGAPDSRPVLRVQPEREIQPDVSTENAVGAEARGRVVRGRTRSRQRAVRQEARGFLREDALRAGYFSCGNSRILMFL